MRERCQTKENKSHVCSRKWNSHAYFEKSKYSEKHLWKQKERDKTRIMINRRYFLLITRCLQHVYSHMQVKLDCNVHSINFENFPHKILIFMQSYIRNVIKKKNTENWYRDTEKIMYLYGMRYEYTYIQGVIRARVYIYHIYDCACLITTLIQGKIRFDRAICKVHDSICVTILEFTDAKLIRRAKGRKSIKP